MGKCKCSDNCSCGKKNDQLERLLKLSLVESSYNLVDDLSEDDDDMPEDFAAPEEEAEGEMSEISPDESEVEPEEIVPDEVSTPEAPIGDDMAMDSQVEPIQSKDEVQDQILKLQLSAMDKMHSALDEIKRSNDDLHKRNMELELQLSSLNKDVEEVREPTNIEKLDSKKNDSHPFYYGLNDMWVNNAFQARMDQDDLGNGIRQLEDGTYVAEFDDLPKLSEKELNDF